VSAARTHRAKANRGASASRRVRLDRAISKLGLASRSEAQRLIEEQRVSVSGRLCTDPARLVVPETARIVIDGQAIARTAWRTIAFHKPRGVVTTKRDPHGRPTVYDVLGEAAHGLIPVGRLDMASTGLLLLTSDTQLANRLTDPINGVPRRYAVTVRGSLEDDKAARMTAGIEDLRATAVAIRKRSRRETHLMIELREGKNREVRRMLDALGHEVTRLLRVSFGPIELGTLQPGRWREVAREELA
jgi:23S rRNA pseudouridine2605 synthase